MYTVKKKVMLGMSGGVDSSVAALLLLEMGYEVIGVTLKMWSPKEGCNTQGSSSCCSLLDIEDAKNVANKLGIAHYVLNAKLEFDSYVIQRFISDYLNGRTPNPCIYCNKYIKFDLMLKKALSMGTDYIATGHYARIQPQGDRFLLKTSLDPFKDQSYVLYNITQSQLQRTLMPLGNFTKQQIRKMAKEAGLVVASKPDSQDICFVHNNDYAKFIKEYSSNPVTPGYFVDSNGGKLGMHKGIIYYTIGQRRGLGIALGKPMFVTKINAATNTIVLGEPFLSKKLIANELNWISIKNLNEPMKVEAKIRYSAKRASATIAPLSNDNIEVIFDFPQRSITPGQAVVFYDTDTVIGGGTII